MEPGKQEPQAQWNISNAEEALASLAEARESIVSTAREALEAQRESVVENLKQARDRIQGLIDSIRGNQHESENSLSLEQLEAQLASLEGSIASVQSASLSQLPAIVVAATSAIGAAIQTAAQSVALAGFESGHFMTELTEAKMQAFDAKWTELNTQSLENNRGVDRLAEFYGIDLSPYRDERAELEDALEQADSRTEKALIQVQIAQLDLDAAQATLDQLPEDASPAHRAEAERSVAEAQRILQETQALAKQEIELEQQLQQQQQQEMNEGYDAARPRLANARDQVISAQAQMDQLAANAPEQVRAAAQAALESAQADLESAQSEIVALDRRQIDLKADQERLALVDSVLGEHIERTEQSLKEQNLQDADTGLVISQYTESETPNSFMDTQVVERTGIALAGTSAFSVLSGTSSVVEPDAPIQVAMASSNGYGSLASLTLPPNISAGGISAGTDVSVVTPPNAMAYSDSSTEKSTITDAQEATIDDVAAGNTPTKDTSQSLNVTV